MNIFANLRLMIPRWEVVDERFLTEEEKQNIESAIVVKSLYGYALEFLTSKGSRLVPLTNNVDAVIGHIPDIDSIKVLTLKLRDSDPEDTIDTIIRIEF